MIKKSIYEAPETELLLVNFEEAFLQGTNTPGNGYGDNNLGDLDDDDE